MSGVSKIGWIELPQNILARSPQDLLTQRLLRLVLGHGKLGSTFMLRNIPLWKAITLTRSTLFGGIILFFDKPLEALQFGLLLPDRIRNNFMLLPDRIRK